MDLDQAKNTVEKADGVLTSLGKLLKKHWVLLLILLVIYFFYWALTTPLEEDRDVYPMEEYYEDETY